MRRYVIYLLLCFGVLITAVVWAQEAQPDPRQKEPRRVEPPELMIRGAWQPVAVEQVDPAGLWQNAPFSVDAGADTCGTATPLTFVNNATGDRTVRVNDMNVTLADPVLACMWGAPSSPRGYRTVWYKFVAPNNGRVTIDTMNSNYDTVLAVHTGACDSLFQVACNDDFNGFTSRASFDVIRDVTYYVVVADWNAAVSGQATLNIAVWLEPIDSRWQQVLTSPSPPAISRHATVAVGPNIYVIGGQSTLGASPVLSQELRRFETHTGNWVNLQPMPGFGLSNTTAAYVNGRIYVPGGYNGNNQTFDGTHYLYDLAANVWVEAAPIHSPPDTTWPHGEPFAWSAAAVPPEQNGYYLVGGLSSQPPFTDTVQVHNQMFFYLPAQNRWFERAPMSTPRYAHTADWVGNRLCVAGGIDDNSFLLPNGECYDPATGSWAPTGAMINARYAAGSAVAPDGRWFVFGGADADGAVSLTEVYDPATNNWSALDVSYDLGGSIVEPARAWPRGEFIGNELWVIGGNNLPHNQALPLLEKLFVYPRHLLLPIVFKSGIDPSDDHIGVARPLALNQPQQNNFANLTDFYDFFYFDLPQARVVTIRLTNIPSDSDYDFSVFDANKTLRGGSSRPGSADESLSLTLLPGRYYIMVQRIFPTAFPNPAPYVIVVQG